VSPVRYKLGFSIPEDGILHNHRRENLKSYSLTNVPYSALVLHGSYERYILLSNNLTSLFHKELTKVPL
jgi:hypothetical protein